MVAAIAFATFVVGAAVAIAVACFFCFLLASVGDVLWFAVLVVVDQRSYRNTLIIRSEATWSTNQSTERGR